MRGAPEKLLANFLDELRRWDLVYAGEGRGAAPIELANS
jgi:hypothetical protein